jgi:dolichol-phosphate mannosyltransferase
LVTNKNKIFVRSDIPLHLGAGESGNFNWEQYMAAELLHNYSGLEDLVAASPKVSVIIPTLNEADSIPLLLQRVSDTMLYCELPYEIIVVDDNSCDGTADMVEELRQIFPVQVIRRKFEKGLASAVLRGCEEACGDVLVVMDADLSHPPEKIPELVSPILGGKTQASIASRYIKGGGIRNWPWYRILVSRFAGLLGRTIANVSDPTSGFFAIERKTALLASARPIGWKIGLELLARSGCTVAEVPFVFTDRSYGHSKFGIRQVPPYIRQILSLQLGRLFGGSKI